jgi:hypothetical protein
MPDTSALSMSNAAILESNQRNSKFTTIRTPIENSNACGGRKEERIIE